MLERMDCIINGKISSKRQTLLKSTLVLSWEQRFHFGNKLDGAVFHDVLTVPTEVAVRTETPVQRTMIR